MSASDTGLRHASIVFGMLVLAIIVCHDGWFDIVSATTSSQSSGAGIMAFAAAIYLLWTRRDRAYPPGRGSWSTLAVALGGAVAYGTGTFYDVHFLIHIGSIFFALGMVCSVLHGATLRVLMPIAVALLFAIPVPGIANELISVPLQLVDARLVEFIGHAAGLPVTRAGTLITINDVIVDIDRGCDGLRLVWPMMLAAYVAAAVGMAPRWMRVSVCVMAIPAALGLNLIRLATTTFLYGYTSPETAAVVHDILGWVLVVSAGFVPFMFLRANSKNVTDTPILTSSTPATILSDRTRTTAANPVFSLAIAGILVVSTTSINSSDLEPGRDEELRYRISTLPYRVDRWIGADRPVPPRESEILDADALVQRVYHQIETDDKLLLLVAYHRDGRRASGHNAPKCYRVRGWEVVSESPRRWMLDGISIDGTAYVLARGQSRMTVFEIFSSPTASTLSRETRVGGAETRALLRVQFLFAGSQAESVAVTQAVERFLPPLIRPQADTKYHGTT